MTPITHHVNHVLKIVLTDKMVINSILLSRARPPSGVTGSVETHGRRTFGSHVGHRTLKMFAWLEGHKRHLAPYFFHVGLKELLVITVSASSPQMPSCRDCSVRNAGIKSAGLVLCEAAEASSEEQGLSFRPPFLTQTGWLIITINTSHNRHRVRVVCRDRLQNSWAIFWYVLVADR